MDAEDDEEDDLFLEGSEEDGLLPQESDRPVFSDAAGMRAYADGSEEDSYDDTAYDAEVPDRTDDEAFALLD